eukprot:CAMPEP_0113314712 /NCGR_PEP_ID=MMETSP0010_2-20120614/10659_1 /TAXON_ID=216773 ORGANISM="Corethron hystrix, Strain 308" /NCGR_SAMPLE_ID=MMETSP0010_2 /ASSEMBLY_ACC=CAM_ASM_000155 /LENGTH=64 /DNA_ID=CAMNT_0000171045 /DNA_START=8 /DNA_END=202 /DNA_ORIENTATION=- /assembly_acc=CAM_ASM_000155
MGGFENKADGNYTAITGGTSNTAIGFASSISGGYKNRALVKAKHSSILGGKRNKAKKTYQTMYE